MPRRWLAALLLAPAAAAAEPCPAPSLMPTVFTPAGTAIPKDGGVVVLDQTGYGAPNPHGAPATWQFVQGAHRQPAKLRTIAPGLTILAGTGRELRDAHDKPLVTLAVGEPATLPAPDVVTVTYATGGCRVLADGTQASAVGDEVRLQWVDGAGRVSPPSKPIKVTAQPAAAAPPHAP
jgi:hypothetical protein